MGGQVTAKFSDSAHKFCSRLLTVFLCVGLGLLSPSWSAESEQVMLGRVQHLRLELKNQEALKYADAAVMAYPRSVGPLMARSDIFKELGLMKQAGADLEAAVKLAPQNDEVLRKRCRLLDMTGHLTEALAAYDVILKKNPKDANFWSYRGQANKRLSATLMQQVISARLSKTILIVVISAPGCLKWVTADF